MSDPVAIKAALAEEAHQRGFDAFGVVKPDAWTLEELDARIAEVRALYLARLGE